MTFTSCKWLCNDIGLYCTRPSPAIKGRMRLNNTDYCLGCSVYEPKEDSPMINCNYCNSAYTCIHDSSYRCICLFKDDWDIAEKRCKYFQSTTESKLRNVLRRIGVGDLTFLESMLENDPTWTLKQISLSLSSRYDP